MADPPQSVARNVPAVMCVRRAVRRSRRTDTSVTSRTARPGTAHDTDALTHTQRSRHTRLAATDRHRQVTHGINACTYDTHDSPGRGSAQPGNECLSTLTACVNKSRSFRFRIRNALELYIPVPILIDMTNGAQPDLLGWLVAFIVSVWLERARSALGHLRPRDRGHAPAEWPGMLGWPAGPRMHVHVTLQI